MKLTRDFYVRDSLSVARDLIGKILVTKRDGVVCGGKIVETEAYLGRADKAAHSYKDKGRNGRTNIMYGEGGYAYVYLIYGMYFCFNAVANVKNIPEAVLVRAVEPLFGIDVMCSRRGIVCEGELSYKLKYSLCSGPGKLCGALDITKRDYGIDLCGDDIYIEDGGSMPADILATPRINVQYAQEDSLLPYRFTDKNSRYLSKFNI